MTQVISISGYSRTGKDTVAREIITTCRQLDPEFRAVRRSFAWLLKKTAHEVYGWAGVQPEAYYDENPEERHTIIPALGCDVVQVWIDLGMKLREIYQDTWIKQVEGEIESGKYDLVVIPDCRFKNEIDMADEHNARRVRTNREGAEPRGSDTHLDSVTDWHAETDPKGSLEDLKTLGRMLAIQALETCDV